MCTWGGGGGGGDVARPTGNKLALLEIKLQSQCVASARGIGGLSRDVAWAGRVGLRQWQRVLARGSERKPAAQPGSARPFSASRKVFFFPTRLARAPELRYLILARVWTRDPWSPAELGLPSARAAGDAAVRPAGAGRARSFPGGWPTCAGPRRESLFSSLCPGRCSSDGSRRAREESGGRYAGPWGDATNEGDPSCWA